MQEGVSKGEKRPSVRKELAKLKNEVDKREEVRAKEKTNVKNITPKAKTNVDR